MTDDLEARAREFRRKFVKNYESGQHVGGPMEMYDQCMAAFARAEVAAERERARVAEAQVIAERNRVAAVDRDAQTAAEEWLRVSHEAIRQMNRAEAAEARIAELERERDEARAESDMQSGLQIRNLQARALHLENQVERANAELIKIAGWLERQATRDEAEANKPNQFVTMREACLADAKNYRATAKHVRAALADLPEKEDGK